MRIRQTVAAAALTFGAAWVVAACGSEADTGIGGASAEQLAEQLVDATTAAGIVPALTPEIAEAMYGTEAPTVCRAFEGGLSTPAANLIRGNPRQGRRQTISTTAVTYAGLVVQTYCPDVLPDFEAAVRDVDPVEVTR